MLKLITLENSNKQRLIEGVYIKPLKVNSDQSGILVESLRTDWNDVCSAEKPFAMQYYSVTKSGIARDEALWHYHPGGQQDRFIVVAGSIVTAVADDREESPTKGLLNLFLMKSESPYLLVIPKRSLHGFMVVSEAYAILLNFPTRLYDPKEEVRIGYDQAKIKVDKNTFFSWNLVRKEFGLPLS